MQYVLDAQNTTEHQPSTSQAYAATPRNQPLTQASTSCTSLAISSSWPSTSSACTDIDMEMEIPPYLNDLAVSEEIIEDEGDCEIIPPWVRRLCDPEEIARQKDIEAKIQARRAEKSQEAAMTTAQNGESHTLGRKRRAEPEMPAADLNILLPELINRINKMTNSNQQDEVDESAGQYAALIVNSLMSIDDTIRQKAYNDILRFGNNYKPS